MKKVFLLIDDDHDDATIFSTALDMAGNPVDFRHLAHCQDIARYLDDPANPRPDLIFLDLNMPQINGRDCLVKLKADKNHQHIPVVIYSTSSDPKEKEHAIAAGAIGFLTKPSDFKALVNILTKLADSEKELIYQLFAKNR